MGEGLLPRRLPRGELLVERLEAVDEEEAVADLVDAHLGERHLGEG